MDRQALPSFTVRMGRENGREHGGNLSPMRALLYVLLGIALAFSVMGIWVCYFVVELRTRQGHMFVSDGAHMFVSTGGAPMPITPFLSEASSAPDRPSDFALALRARASDGAVVLSMANDGFAPLALHFACAMRRIQRDNFLVVTLGEAVAVALANAGVPAFDVQKLPPSALAGVALPKGGLIANIGGSEFDTICLLKPALILAALSAGLEIVVWSDIDVTWLQDPLPSLAASLRIGAPVVLDGKYVSTMAPVDSSQDGQPRHLVANRYKGHCNAGFLVFRTGALSEQLLRAMLECGVRSKAYEADYKNDQAILNDVAEGCGSGVARHCGDLRVPVRLVALRSKVLLPNGDDFWTKRWAHHDGVLPFLVHNNRCKQDLKLERMRSIGLWMLDDDEEDTEGLACHEPGLLRDSAFASSVAAHPTTAHGHAGSARGSNAVAERPVHGSAPQHGSAQHAHGRSGGSGQSGSSGSRRSSHKQGRT